MSIAQRNALHSVAWGHYHFGGLVTGRSVRRSTVLKLVERGLVESNGFGPMCDGDGAIIVPERYREGFKLTESGIRLAVQQDCYDAIELAKQQDRLRAASEAAP